VVVIPAHNEAEDIAFVVREIRKHCDYPVVVVDDASTDATCQEANGAGAVVIPLAVQLGAWGAIQAGLRYALRNGFTHVITMDADGQHQPASLPTLLRPIVSDEADVVIGACTRRGSPLRQIAWKLMRKVWQATLLEYQDVGVLAMLQASGLRIQDVEVDMLPRRHGISRVFHSWASVIYYMSYTLLLGITKRGMKHEQPS
jgi:glycosyltransferase involved in cell wall biosynthesis